ncbi:MAG: 2,3-bisphosphoglycerate-independent phosphoglycerate mutase [Alphaproteobacteria bacterium]
MCAYPVPQKRPTQKRPPQKRPVVLCILDGWGWRDETENNAVALADTPTFDRLWSTCPHTFLRTSGLDVGLPEGQMGNSEVGHMNIGAGRVVMQDLPRIDHAIESGTFAQNETLHGVIDALKRSGGRAHVAGLLSPGGVHSHQRHMAAVVNGLTQAGVPVTIHGFLDGRDTAPKSAAGFVESFETSLVAEARGQIGTISGRYYAMDRDKRWERVKRAYDCIVDASGERAATWQAAIDAAYAADLSDEFALPTVIGAYSGMADGDALIFINFRADRARQLLGALLDPEFDGFEARRPHLCACAGMVEYSTRLAEFMTTLFPPETLEKTLGEVAAEAGLTQLRIAETEKYPHVTFFLNGGREEVYGGEDRIMVQSPKVATYDLQPEMSAKEVTDQVTAAIRTLAYDLVVINFANPDMVGHTGSLEAAKKAVETVDVCLGRLTSAVRETGGVMLVTADHGNCEMMVDPSTGGPHTAHTTFVVPALLVNAESLGTDVTLKDGRLADIAPTLLALLGQPQPAQMTGMSLLKAAS